VDQKKYDKRRPHPTGGERVTAFIIAAAAAVLGIGWIAWSVIKRRMPAWTSPQGTSARRGGGLEADDWRQRAGALCRDGQEVVRDLDPDIVASDGSAQSRDMRASWLRRAAGTARTISASISDLETQAGTARGKATARNASDGLSRLAAAASNLEGTMDDAALLGRLASEQKKAEESLRDLQRMVLRPPNPSYRRHTAAGWPLNRPRAGRPGPTGLVASALLESGLLEVVELYGLDLREFLGLLDCDS